MEELKPYEKRLSETIIMNVITGDLYLVLDDDKDLNIQFYFDIETGNCYLDESSAENGDYYIYEI